MKPKTGVTGLDVAFGPKDIKEYLPEYEKVPEKFKEGQTPQNKLFSKWFFAGLPNGDMLVAKPGISKREALAHIKVGMSSFEPKHEHKEAGCAYLLSEWFEEGPIEEFLKGEK